MHGLIWEPEAEEQLASILTFIGARNLPAAGKIKRLIEGGLESVQRLPYIGRPGRVVGTRELIVHPNYVVIYRVTDAAIDVLRVLHARQRYP